MAAPHRPDHVVIRERMAADDMAIRRLNDDAFGGPYESRLIEDLRAAGLDAVELVAVEDDRIVGHILFSVLATSIDRHTVPALALAPLAVRPERQRRGIGSALVRAGLDLARERDWRAVIVLGHKGYYPRFGFSAALARPLRAPFAGDAFMALELAPGALQGKQGRVTYPPAFAVTNA
jgi:putative acetyltransferase